MTTLEVAVSFDENYAQHAAVTIASLLRNSSSPINLHVLHDRDNISGRTRRRIESLRKYARNGVSIEWHHIDFSRVQAGMSEEHWSPAFFYRLLLPEIITEGRVLYLDTDTVVLGDLTEFFTQDMEGKHAVAVSDLGWYVTFVRNKKDPGRGDINIIDYLRDKLGMETEEEVKGYFNSGVMLLDMDMISGQNLFAGALELAKATHFIHKDQDVLNILLKGKIKYASDDYNFMYGRVINDKDGLDWIIQRFEPYMERGRKPVILHFTNKPWKYHGVLFSRYYWRYLAMTPWWSGFSALIPSGWSVRRWLIRIHTGSIPRLRILGIDIIGKDRYYQLRRRPVKDTRSRV